MPSREQEKKNMRLQSPHLDEEIRTAELVRTVVAGSHKRGNGGEDGGLWGTEGKGRPRRRTPKGIRWAAAGLIVLFVAGFGVSYYAARRALVTDVGAKAENLQAGMEDLKNLDFAAAQQEFIAANGSGGISGIMGVLGSLFSGGTNVASSFGDLSGRLAQLTADLSAAETDAWSAFAVAPAGPADASATSSALVADLEDMRANLAAINGDAGALSGIAQSFGNMGGMQGMAAMFGGAAGGNGDYLAIATELQGAQKFLDAFVPWFADASTTHHVLVLLQNPSEMRPGGGFIGSYADVSVRAGRITGIAVHDVADADAAFAPKIVPPVPLQLEEKGWRPADGNWFFDFPTSASATISLFERSGLYNGSRGASTTFDAAIAVTPQVMRDILSVIGPVSVPDAAIGIVPAKGAPTSTTFTADGLDTEIQSVVQAGQAKGARATVAPKSVEGLLWESALARLASSTDTEKQDILALAGNWIADKDAMVYFKDPAIEQFVRATGAAGDEFTAPGDFNGDYLAVANTDVNSDKSERYVSSTVSWTVALGADGTASDQVTVTRTHHGNQSASWWYRTTNQDWLQLFVPAGSMLTNETGGFVKKVPAPVNYAAAGYTTDPLVAAMESSTKGVLAYPAVAVRNGGGGVDGGKTVFSVWDRTYLASTTKVTFDYSHPMYAIPSDGAKYEFVFERQAGATGEYKMQVFAPLGYVFAENGLASFTYDATGTMPGRLTVDLTLQKL